MLHCSVSVKAYSYRGEAAGRLGNGGMEKLMVDVFLNKMMTISGGQEREWEHGGG